MPQMIYACDHCGKTPIGYRNKDIDKVKNHEKDCLYNPEKRLCASCNDFGSKYSDRVCSSVRHEEVSKYSKGCKYWKSVKE